MPYRVSADDIDRFEQDGVVVLRSAMNPDELAALAEAVERNLSDPGEWASDYTPQGGAGRFFGDYVNWERIDAYRHIATESALALAARDLMRSGEVRFFHEHVLVKEPGTTEITPWHHDDPYYCVDGMQNVSMWISLDPVPAVAGLRFLVGSHQWQRRFVPRKFVDASPYAAAEQGFELVPDIEAELHQHRIVTFDIEPGDVVAFHYRTLHAAPGTAGLTDHRRRAVSMRYVGDDAVFALRPWLHSPPFEIDPATLGGPLDNNRFPLIDFALIDGER